RLQCRQIRDALVRIGRRGDADRDRVEGLGGVGAEQLVDRRRHMRRGGEIGRVEVERQVRVVGETHRHFALDRGAVGDAAAAGYVEGDARAVLAVDAEAAYHDAALRDGVELG